VERALVETARLLQPRGFLGITVYCNPADILREHFPHLHTYRTVVLGDSMILVNRRADGGLEIREDLIFHGGTGETLEMREFGITSLKRKLLGAGFREVHLLTEDIPLHGILFDDDVSQPLLARKERFIMNRAAVLELIEEQRVSQAEIDRLREEAETLRAQMSMAAESRWIKLGRKFGAGPDFNAHKR
jgi:hypothetical protein